MTPIFFNRSIHPFHGVFCNFYKSLLVSAGNSPFSVMFEVLQLSLVIDVDSFFTKITAEWGQVAQGLVDVTQSPKNSCKKAAVSAVWRSPRLFLKPAIPFVFFQHSYELKHKPLTTTEDFHALHVGFQHSFNY